MEKVLNLVQLKEFITGGKAFLTIRNNNSGERRTYKFFKYKNQTNPHMVYVNGMVGLDNENSYTFLGRFDIRNLQYIHKINSRINEDAVIVKGIKYMLFQLANNTTHAAIEYWHEGKCCRCGRLLTTPESIDAGIGPECIKHRNK